MPVSRKVVNYLLDRTTSRDFRERLDSWGAQGVILHYLPPYCPELNRIEILWHKIKYDWLPLSCYTQGNRTKQTA